MFAYLHRIIPCYYALLSILLGLSLAWAFSSVTALYLDSGIDVSNTLEQQQVVSDAQLPTDNKVILQRNIFNSSYDPSANTPQGKASAQAESMTAVPNAQGKGDMLSDTELAGRNVKEAKNMELIGTIAGGVEGIAVIKVNGEIGVYRIGDPIATSAKVVKIERLRTYIENSDSSISILEIDSDFAPGTSSPPSSEQSGARAAVSSAGGVKQISDTRWRISSDRAEQIRTNIATVVRQARVEPVVAQGQTRGFVVKYIQPGTLLTEMGLKRGDVIKEVNGISLDSPEKGLQVFQQLRESKSMDLSIERNNSPMTFKYEIR